MKHLPVALQSLVETALASPGMWTNMIAYVGDVAVALRLNDCKSRLQECPCYEQAELRKISHELPKPDCRFGV